ncbi:MAG: DUF58 domain-containing protein [Microcystaceae cyanobacterium]
MIPTQRLYGLLLLGLALAPLLNLLFPQSLSLLFILLYDIILLGISIWENQQTKQNRCKIQRLTLHNLSIGRKNPVNITVEAPNQKITLQIQDHLPPSLTVADLPFTVQLSPNQSENLTYFVFPSERGELTWGNLQIRQQGKWGLTWHDWTVAACQTVAVYPDLVGLRSLSIRLTLENTGTMRQARRLGIGTDFSELREYRQGDDLRFMDWKATARRSQPYIRILEPDREQSLIILLDQGRLMTAQVEGLKRFDWGINAALSLALAGLHRGDKVGIGVFEKKMTTWVGQDGGISHLNTLISRLTPLQPVFREPDYLSAVNQLVKYQPRRALVVVLTDIVDQTASAELLSAMGRLTPRYLPFCIALRDPQVDHIAHTPTTEVESAYARAVALDLLSQREKAFAQLKQKGVLVLDAPVNQISEQLVNRYLQLKARNLL